MNLRVKTKDINENGSFFKPFIPTPSILITSENENKINLFNFINNTNNNTKHHKITITRRKWDNIFTYNL